MKEQALTPLESREIFHIEFLRWLGRRLDQRNYALKGGVNLRLFFQSPRYSEDMDLDVAHTRVDTLKSIVMKILLNTTFQDSLKTFGIQKIIPPAIEKAKQTETTQMFKVHLINSENKDLFTKVEFSRRGFAGEVTVAPVPNVILRRYKTAPLIVPHYPDPLGYSSDDFIDEFTKKSS